MRDPANWENQARRPNDSPRRDIGQGTLEVLLSRWKVVLPGSIILAVLILFLLPNLGAPGNAGPGIPSVPGQAGPAAPAGSGSESGLAAATGPDSGATAVSAPTVAPTPTPAAIRPLAIPTAPPAPNHGSPPTRIPDTPDPDPTTEHVVVVDGDSGAILFERNAHERVAPASLTKIMTGILGLEYGRLDEKVKIDVTAALMTESTVMGLEPWFDVVMEDLLYGLMLPSGNDAALAIGRHVSGNDATFVELMNQKAAWLGLKSTHFANPHGLDDPNHYSSPYDMVVMARYAMQYPKFREIVSTKSYDIARSNIAYTIYNLNPLIGAYPDADGVKTGFTDNAGKALVGTAVRNGHRVYVAFMRSDGGAAYDGALLLDWAFSSFIWPE